MRIVAFSVLALAAATFPVHAAEDTKTPTSMLVPSGYREWVFLTSGFDMTYASPTGAGVPSHSVFDNVFVNPDAYKTFVKSGVWPDETTFVLENRAAESNVSINKAGLTQGADITGIELHRKVHGEWAFYVHGKDGNEKLVPKPASCYTCHEEHAAVDTTFVQFYPTLMPIAESKKVFSDKFRAESAGK